METSDGVTVATKSTCWTWWRIVYKRSKIIKWVCGAWLRMPFVIHQPTSPHQVISYNRPLKMMLRWRHGLLLRLVRVDLNGGVHRVALLVQTHRWARRIDSTAHAWHANDRCRLFRWSYLKYKKRTLDMSRNDFRKLLTSSPMLPLSENLIGFEWLLACIKVVKWLIPISSSDDFLRPWFIPRLGKPCRSELDRLRRMSLSI